MKYSLEDKLSLVAIALVALMAIATLVAVIISATSDATDSSSPTVVPPSSQAAVSTAPTPR